MRNTKWPPLPFQEWTHFNLTITRFGTLRRENQSHFAIRGVDNPETGNVLLRLKERPTAKQGLALSIINHGSRVGGSDSARQDPLIIGSEFFIEDINRLHLIAGGGVGGVVNNGD